METTKFSYRFWKDQVDTQMEKIGGIDSYLFPDIVSFRDMYDDGLTPEEAARQALEELSDDEGVNFLD